MASLYKHPELYDRLKDSGPVDRFVRGIKVTWEHMISLAPATSPEGIVCNLLTVDLVGPDKRSAISLPLAIYQWDKGPEAFHDGEMVARKLGLAFRKGNPAVGWETVADPDGPKPVIATSMEDFRI